jgi:hypothetical protein
MGELLRIFPLTKERVPHIKSTLYPKYYNTLVEMAKGAGVVERAHSCPNKGRN